MNPLFTIQYDWHLNKKMIKGKILFRGEAILSFEKPKDKQQLYELMVNSLNRVLKAQNAHTHIDV